MKKASCFFEVIFDRDRREREGGRHLLGNEGGLYPPTEETLVPSHHRPRAEHRARR